MNIERKLQEELSSELDILSKIEVGTDEYKTAVDGITKLMDRAIELEKLDVECTSREKAREDEYSLKVQQMIDDRKDRAVKNALTALSITSGVGLTVWGALKSWKFEETGTVVSTAGRKFINSLFFKK